MSNASLIDNFIKEFKEVFTKQMSLGSKIYLLDIMEDLKFLDSADIKARYDRIEKFLKEKGTNLIIDLEAINEEHLFVNQRDIRNNIVQVCLGI